MTHRRLTLVTMNIKIRIKLYVKLTITLLKVNKLVVEIHD